MIYGLCNSARIEAFPGGRAICPTCGGDLAAKCGQIKKWHWAHVAKECDQWSEGESAWHRDWKELVPPERREVVRGPHRADIVGPGGGVIELQHSSISCEEIAEREAFYGKMVWVFDASEFRKNLSIRDRGDFLSFRWKWPRTSLLTVTKPMFFDLDHGLLEVKKIGDESPVGGWGYFREKSWFCDKYLGVKTGFFDCGKAAVCDNYEPCIVCSRSTRRDDGKHVVVDSEPVLRLICFDCHIDHLRGAG